MPYPVPLTITLPWNLFICETPLVFIERTSRIAVTSTVPLVHHVRKQSLHSPLLPISQGVIPGYRFGLDMNNSESPVHIVVIVWTEYVLLLKRIELFTPSLYIVVVVPSPRGGVLVVVLVKHLHQEERIEEMRLSEAWM